MNKRVVLLTLLIVVVAIIGSVAALYSYGTLLNTHSHHSSSTTSTGTIPVVDVIIPSLVRKYGSGDVNSQLNLTDGESITLLVQVYSTANLNLSMTFQAYLLGSTSIGSNASDYFTSSFANPILSVKPGVGGSTNMTLHVLDDAPQGVYNAVVSASDVKNASDVWGTLFQIKVGG
jgi:hypothetical protein